MLSHVHCCRLAHELGIRDRGGFFKEGEAGDTYCTALIDAAAHKTLMVGGRVAGHLNFELKWGTMMVGAGHFIGEREGWVEG